MNADPDHIVSLDHHYIVSLNDVINALFGNIILLIRDTGHDLSLPEHMT